MMKVSKTDSPHLYINILDFKDVTEQEIIFRKIQLMLKEWQTIPKVYGK